MTTTAKIDWPRTYLLRIYQQAIEHGIIYIEPIDQPTAVSLRQRLYRLRRRADKQMAQFILPEYNLVTVGEWSPENGGRLPIIYDQMPDSAPLPAIHPADPSEVERFRSAQIPAPPVRVPVDPVLESIDAADLTMRPDEVSSYVSDLISKAKKKGVTQQ